MQLTLDGVRPIRIDAFEIGRTVPTSLVVRVHCTNLMIAPAAYSMGEIGAKKWFPILSE